MVVGGKRMIAGSVGDPFLEYAKEILWNMKQRAWETLGLFSTSILFLLSPEFQECYQ